MCENGYVYWYLIQNPKTINQMLNNDSNIKILFQDIFEMVIIGCFDRMAPQCIENADQFIEEIIETYQEAL